MAAELAPELFELYRSRPRVAILMSGLGSNARAILASESVRDLYDITCIVTDNSGSSAVDIATYHGLELLQSHQERFAGTRERDEYFGELASKLGNRGVQGAIYAGFMKITPQAFTRDFPGLNIHPANLTIADTDGTPRYRGMDALPSMRSDLGYVQSSVHVVDTPVDTGAVVALTRPLAVDDWLSDDAAHDLLKVEERLTFPETLRLVGAGVIRYGDTPTVPGGTGRQMG